MWNPGQPNPPPPPLSPSLRNATGNSHAHMNPHPADEAPEGFLRSLRKTFFTGLVLCLPLALTAYIVKFLIDLLGAPARDLVVQPVIKAFLSKEAAAKILENDGLHVVITLVSALFAVIVILAVGMITRHFLGRVVFDAFEGVLERVPMVNKVYNAVKQMVDTFGSKADTFKEVVIVEYPRAGCRSVGFVANRAPMSHWCANGGEEKLVHVFVPTAPNPTAGFILLLPESEVIVTDMTVAEGMKFIVSCGAYLPATGEPPACEK